MNGSNTILSGALNLQNQTAVSGNQSLGNTTINFYKVPQDSEVLSSNIREYQTVEGPKTRNASSDSRRSGEANPLKIVEDDLREGGPAKLNTI